ncbi:DUF3592 domain-containing protein [Streptomyces tendae]|uniref:DUF3592 domain-containing protein n=1 Tax=Streptomyces tendae TaxID=1932 RepID=UPI00366039B0
MANVEYCEESVMPNGVSAFVGFLLLCVSGVVFFCSYFVLVRAGRAVRLVRHGVRALGSCVGYSAGRSGQSVIIDYRTDDGRDYTMTTEFWVGRLPERGSKMEILYLPGNPKVSDIAPLRFRHVIPKVLTAVLLSPLFFFIALSLVWSGLERMGVHL